MAHSVAGLTSGLQDSRSTLYHKLRTKVFPDVSNCASSCKAALIWESSKYLWSGFVVLILTLAVSLPSWDPGRWGTKGLFVPPSLLVYWEQKITWIGPWFYVASWMWKLKKITWKCVWLTRCVCCYITGDALVEKKTGCRSEPVGTEPLGCSSLMLSWLETPEGLEEKNNRTGSCKCWQLLGGKIWVRRREKGLSFWVVVQERDRAQQ